METHLEDWRKEIDELDKELIKLLGRRFEISKKIGELKLLHKLSIVDAKRYEALLEKVKVYAKEHNIDTGFIETIFSIIHDQSIKIQKKKI